MLYMKWWNGVDRHWFFFDATILEIEVIAVCVVCVELKGIAIIFGCQILRFVILNWKNTGCFAFIGYLFDFSERIESNWAYHREIQVDHFSNIFINLFVLVRLQFIDTVHTTDLFEQLRKQTQILPRLKSKYMWR